MRAWQSGYATPWEATGAREICLEFIFGKPTDCLHHCLVKAIMSEPQTGSEREDGGVHLEAC